MSDFSVRDEKLFYQRLDELCGRSTERYCPEFTHFLDGREFAMAQRYLLGNFGVKHVSFGGFPNAERRVIGVFPDVVYGEAPENELYEYFDIKGVCIKGSGFSSFNHRDVMGSVLSLGIKRETLGDIYVPDDMKSAYLCLGSVAAEYVCSSLDFVARDKVKCTLVDAALLPEMQKRFSVISGTVASERLDCIVALVTGTSREKSKTLVTSGVVSVNHFPELKCDFMLCDNDILSVRGYGRFVVAELGGLTRKGRNRIVVHKMI